MILVLLVSTSIVLLSLVTKQRTVISAAAAADEFILNPNAKRFYSNIRCNDFAEMIRSANGADKATIVVDASTYKIQPSWFATFGDDGQDFYKNNCANSNDCTNNNNNNLSSICS